MIWKRKSQQGKKKIICHCVSSFPCIIFVPFVSLFSALIYFLFISLFQKHQLL